MGKKGVCLGERRRGLQGAAGAIRGDERVCCRAAAWGVSADGRWGAAVAGVSRRRVVLF